MSNKINPDYKEEKCKPEKFWNIYFNKEFVSLTRGQNEHIGVFMDYSKANKNLFVQFPKFAQISVKRKDLIDYEYNKDIRFKIFYEKISDAIQSEFSLSLYNENTLGNALILGQLEMMTGRQTVRYEQRRIKVLEEIENSNIRFEEITESLRIIRSAQIFLIRVLAKTLLPEAYEILKHIVMNPYENHEVAIAAIKALARFNRKKDIEFFVEILKDEKSFSLHPTINEALQFLCSSQELLTKPTDVELAPFWESVLPGLPKKTEQWLIHDSKSVFWEKRFLVALDYKKNEGCPSEVLQYLSGDEVLPIQKIIN